MRHGKDDRSRTACVSLPKLIALKRASGRPRDFDAIAVPFPERGEPALVKPEREPEPAGAPAL